MNIDAIAYVNEKNWETKPANSNGELQVKSCPYCGDTKHHFYISLKREGSPYWCHKCGAKGNLNVLRRHQGDDTTHTPRNLPVQGVGELMSQFLGKEDPVKYRVFDNSWIDEYHQDLMNDVHGSLSELRKRGINDETAQHFRLGVSQECNGKSIEPSWVIPTWTDDHTIGLVKYRTVPPSKKRMYREKDMQSVLFNHHGLDTGLSRVIVTEGEIDAISVWQSGHRNVVSVPAGAKSLKPEWIDTLTQFDEIVLVYDQDKAGIEGRSEVRKRLGEDKVLICELPVGMDCNDLLVNGGETALREAIDDAIIPPIEGITSTADALMELQRDLMMGEDVDAGLEWMFSGMNESIGKVPPGSLVVVTGKMGTGKTTLLKQQLLEWAKQGEACFLWCGEMTPKQLVIQLVQCICSVERRDITVESVQEAFELLKDCPLYLGHTGLTPSVDEVLNMATYCYKRYGAKIVCLDNLLAITRGKGDPMEQQSKVTLAAKNWCQYYEGTMFLVAHPRKEGSDAIEGRESISGSQDVLNLADMVFTVYRKDQSPKTSNDIMGQMEDTNLDRRTSIVPIKGRYSGGRGVAWIYNEGEYSRFRDCNIDDFGGA